MGCDARQAGRGAVSLLLWVIGAGLFAGTGDAAADSGDWRERLSRPSPEFSQMPFWFWNDRLDEAEIRRQLADWREHGVYGFVIHARMGLPTDIAYMGPRWLELVKFAVEEAARTNMRVCLYDEGMYPSGSAHGEVVKSNPAFAAQGLAVSLRDATGPAEVPCPPAEGRHVATVVAARRGEKGIDLSTARVIEAGATTVQVPAGEWRVMSFGCVPSGGRIRGVHEGEEDRQPGAPAAADLLNPQAMQRFLELAYEPYRRTVGEHFGKTVIGMFTDEPSMLGRGGRRGLQPWTQGFAEFFESKRGYSLLPLLPALFFEAGERTAAIRADYRLTLAERLDESYYRPLSEWCHKNGIALTGHPAGATEIHPLRYFQIPGQDIVWRGVVPDGNRALEGHNSAIGKCSSSVARHDGRRFNANEVYGAFGWQLTMEEMKWLADWLMVRGVNLLFPHAFYYSIRDYRVHERPPDVGPNNLWWPHYRVFADYTARLCGLLTDSRQVCDVAVLGGNHHLPWRAAKWLYQNQVDFNYVEDWRLVEQARVVDGKIQVGPMTYAVLIVDGNRPATGPVAEALRRLEAGGAVVRDCGETPGSELIRGIERDVTASPAADALRYVHLVRDGIHFYLLVNEGEGAVATELTVRYRGAAEWFDAWTGEFRAVRVVRQGEQTTTVQLDLPRRESLVLCVDPASSANVSVEPAARLRPADPIVVDGPWSVSDSGGKSVGNALGNWLEWPGMERYAGTLTYRTRVRLAKAAGARYTLDLGGVGDYAVVRVNGSELPVRFWAPFAWDVTDQLTDGENELTVDVTNSLVNRYDEQIRRPSGLFGPVRLMPHMP